MKIKKEIQKDLGYLMDVNHNMLYPTLRKFTDEGFVRKHRNEQVGRPNQYVYEITEAGREQIANLINEFTEKMQNIKSNSWLECPCSIAFRRRTGIGFYIGEKRTWKSCCQISRGDWIRAGTSCSETRFYYIRSHRCKANWRGSIGWSAD